jgi:hypothetical protein
MATLDKEHNLRAKTGWLQSTKSTTYYRDTRLTISLHVEGYYRDTHLTVSLHDEDYYLDTRLTVSLHDEGYYRDTSCVLSFIDVDMSSL